MSFDWIWRMAWRDSRKSLTHLALFTASIVTGIAALVAINSFGDSLRREIDEEAKTLIGADLVVRGRESLPDSTATALDSLPAQAQATEVSFASMILFPKSGGTRLVQIRSLSGDYPFYGEIETLPTGKGRTFQQGRQALVDQTLLLQYSAQVGDSIKVGRSMFLIAGSIEKAPGEVGLSATVAPSVYIPGQYLEETGLVQKGSRINYTYYYLLEKEAKMADVEEMLKPIMKRESLRYETIDMRKESTGEAFTDLTQFLNLVGFVALLLGCVGVASAVHIYVKEKLASVAVLRCLGATGQQSFLIFLVQIVGMGLGGAVLGTVLGVAIQFYLPVLLKNLLPIEVDVVLSWKAVLQGVGTGVAISALFAALPLLAVRRISPLRTLRTSYEEDTEGFDAARWVVYALILLFVFGFSWLQLDAWKEAAIFTGSLLGAFLSLAALSVAFMWAVRKYFPNSWGYVWRQGLANLYRPQNQTPVLIVSIGLGTALLTTLFLVQGLLLGKVQLAGSDNQPNMVLFDIQTPDKESVTQLVNDFDLPVIQNVPIVTMKLDAINGRTRAQNQADSTSPTPEWAYTREYRVTYRDTLIDSERLVAGRWHGDLDASGDSLFVSVEDGYAKRMGIKLGDKLMFNVQGAPLEVYVGSFRDIDWNRVQTNFLMVFPSGMLETAPQFHVIVTRVTDQNQSAAFQREVVQRYPTISVIDLGLILRTLDEVLGQISFVIRFMAIFSIVTGLIVLVGSVIISKYQRIRESVLLRTLGANQRQVFQINALEYFLLGGLAALSGIVLALGGSWALAYFNFETPFTPDFLPILAVFVVITSLTVIIGLLNSRSIVNRPPLEVLRSEG